jgi:prevent-host-death family protein
MRVDERELQEHLQEYLERAAAGESVEVTRQGLPGVLIVPVPKNDSILSGMAEGWLRPPISQPLGVTRRSRGRGRIEDVLLEDRGD